MGEEMVVGLDIESGDLGKVIYLVNSGIMRIKDVSVSKTPDLYDRKVIKYGQALVDQLCMEYRNLSKEEAI